MIGWFPLNPFLDTNTRSHIFENANLIIVDTPRFNDCSSFYFPTVGKYWYI